MDYRDILQKLMGQDVKKTVVGVDITADTIVVAELRKQRNEIVLVNIAEASTPSGAVQDSEISDPRGVGQVIASLLDEWEITAKKAVVAVAGQSTIVRPVRFPMMPLGELKEVIEYEAERYIPFAIDDVNLDFQVVGEIEEDGAPKQEVILVAAQKALISSLQAALAEAGLEVPTVDVASFAVMRSVYGTDQFTEGKSIAFLHIQGWTTDVSIVVDGVPRFTRSIPIGFSYLLDALINSLGLDDESARAVIDEVDVDPQNYESLEPQVEQATEIVRPALNELTSEISRSLDFYLSQGSHPLDLILLSGRGGNLKNLDRLLTNRLGIQVQVIDSLARLVWDEDEFDADALKAKAPTVAAAIGLALRGVLGP